MVRMKGPREGIIGMIVHKAQAVRKIAARFFILTNTDGTVVEPPSSYTTAISPIHSVDPDNPVVLSIVTDEHPTFDVVHINMSREEDDGTFTSLWVEIDSNTRNDFVYLLSRLDFRGEL